MHQFNWIEYLIGDWRSLAELKRGCQVQWFNSAIEDHHDALGVVLMGGEL